MIEKIIQIIRGLAEKTEPAITMIPLWYMEQCMKRKYGKNWKEMVKTNEL